MKRNISCILTVVFVMSYLIMGCNNWKYPPGKDTYRIFGDGRFQIIVGFEDHKKYYTLYDVTKQNPILSYVKLFLETQEYVYIYGSDYEKKAFYVVLNIVAGKYEKFNTLDEAPQQHRATLSRLSKDGLQPGQSHDKTAR